MSERKWFGTDGIRGVANRAPMTPELALRLGQVLGVAVRGASGSHRPLILIGRDTRVSGPLLESALAAGASSVGADVQLVGVLPTPAVARLTRELGAGAGVVVSASHNPFADNGIKVFDSHGFKLGDDAEVAIEAELEKEGPSVRPIGGDIGRIGSFEDAESRYLAYLLGTVTDRSDIAGKRIVFDGSHGAAFRVGPALFRALGAEVEALGVAPDGVNINEGCGAVRPQAAAALVRATSAAVGVVVDGDADRIVLVDETGEVVDGDEILAILAAHRPQQVGRRLVGTVMSNMGLEVALRERGIELVRASVGDRYVLDEMRRCNSRVGGEPSGHIVLLDYGTTGDGLLAAIQVLDVMASTGAPLSQLRRAMQRMPQVLVNVRVRHRVALEEIPAIAAAMADVERRLDGRGRLLVRYSGTEPLVRIMVEGVDASEVRSLAERLGACIGAEIGEGDARR